MLSDDILLGSTLIAPRAGWGSHGKPGCAGAMAVEASGRRDDSRCTLFQWLYPWTISLPHVPYPCGCYTSERTALVVFVHLFDTHVMTGQESIWNWSFERFLDWVRSVEPREQVYVKLEQSFPVAEFLAK